MTKPRATKTAILRLPCVRRTTFPTPSGAGVFPEGRGVSPNRCASPTSLHLPAPRSSATVDFSSPRTRSSRRSRNRTTRSGPDRKNQAAKVEVHQRRLHRRQRAPLLNLPPPPLPRPRRSRRSAAGNANRRLAPAECRRWRLRKTRPCTLWWDRCFRLSDLARTTAESSSRRCVLTVRLQRSESAVAGLLTMSVPLTYPALVLFDIDGTLLRRAGPDHRQALVEGVRRVTGLDTTTEGIPLHGHARSGYPDPHAARAAARRLHPPGIHARHHRAAERYYQRTCPRLDDKLCPGVEPRSTSWRAADILLGLVTATSPHRVAQTATGRPAGLLPLRRVR